MPVVYGDHPRYANELIGEIDIVLELIFNAISEDDNQHLDRARLHIVGFKKEIRRRLDLHAAGELTPEAVCEGVYC